MTNRITPTNEALQRIAEYILTKAERVVSVDMRASEKRELQAISDDIHLVSEHLTITFEDSWHVKVTMYVRLRWGKTTTTRREGKKGILRSNDLAVEVNWASFSGSSAEATAFLSLAQEVTVFASRLQTWAETELGTIGDFEEEVSGEFEQTMAGLRKAIG